MALFRRSKSPQPETASLSEHAVITHLPLSDDAFGSEAERNTVHELEKQIEAAIDAIGGEHDGDEFGGGEVVLYTYGHDADAMLEAICRCLETFEVRPGAYAVKRYGSASDPRAREEIVQLL